MADTTPAWHYAATLSSTDARGVQQTTMVEYVAAERIATYADIQDMIATVADRFGLDRTRTVVMNLVELR